MLFYPSALKPLLREQLKLTNRQESRSVVWSFSQATLSPPKGVMGKSSRGAGRGRVIPGQRSQAGIAHCKLIYVKEKRRRRDADG